MQDPASNLNPSAAPPPAGDSDTRKRLDSWKDIAVYLGRGVRTVQSWEAEQNLPVHRLKHKANYTVYAWADEIDAWLQARSKAAEPPPAIEAAPVAPAEAPARWRTQRWLLAAGAVIVLTAGFVAARNTALREVGPEPLAAEPFTSSPALEQGARIAPNGREIAFVQAVEPNDPDIVLKLSGAGSVVPLAATPAAEYSPAWSPDSREIAFLRSAGEPELQFLVVASAREGSERTLAPLRAPHYRAADAAPPQIDWSPDGRYLLAPDSIGSGPFSIVVANAVTGEKRQLTAPPVDTLGDVAVRVSPDGGRIAVTRVAAEGQAEILLYDVTANWSGVVERGRLKADGAAFSASPVWTPDGEAILFSAGVESKTEIWAARLDALGDPHRIQSGIEAASVSDVREDAEGAWRMVYGLGAFDLDIIRVPLTKHGDLPVEDSDARREAVAATSYREVAPRLSPEGTRLAYISDRSGSQQIWVMELAGAEPRKLTDIEDGVLSAPRWSPDGKRVLFHSVRSDGAHIYTVSVEDGAVEPIVEADGSFAPEWTQDGRWIYFTSAQPGRRDRAVFRVAAEGGEPETVTLEPAQAAVEAPNGALLIAQRQLKIQHPGDPAPSPISNGPLLDYQSFEVRDEGVFYVADSKVWFRPFAGDSSYVVADHKGNAGPGVSVAPDGSAAFIVAAAGSRADIMLVDDVRASLPHRGGGLFGSM